MNEFFYVLSCSSKSEGGGIYKLVITDSAEFKILEYFPCNYPMYAVRDGNFLHALLLSPFGEGDEMSGYFKIDTSLKHYSEILNTKGKCACHLSVIDNDIYIVNYKSQNVIYNFRKICYHSGKGLHPTRQDISHPHCVIVSPSKERVLVADLGVDTCYIYTRNLSLLNEIKLPGGLGIRHLLFSKDNKLLYSINELKPSVSIFSWDDDYPVLLNTVTLPCKNISSTAAAIRQSSNGKFLYCSVREENAIFVLERNGESLSIVQKAYVDGDGPRDINIISDKFLIACNEKSNNLNVFSLKDNLICSLQAKFDMASPNCCVV